MDRIPKEDLIVARMSASVAVLTHNMRACADALREFGFAAHMAANTEEAERAKDTAYTAISIASKP